MRRALPLVLLALGACVLPARSFSSFQGKAVATADDMRSAVETARLAVTIAAERRAFAPTISVTLANAEHDADAIQGAFDSVQPADKRSDDLRDELDQLLDQATSILSELRIAARRTEWTRLVRSAAPLPELSKKLNEFAEANG
jgi:hypothetical protein